MYIDLFSQSEKLVNVTSYKAFSIQTVPLTCNCVNQAYCFFWQGIAFVGVTLEWVAEELLSHSASHVLCGG
jgi:hypothetical protein